MTQDWKTFQSRTTSFSLLQQIFCILLHFAQSNMPSSKKHGPWHILSFGPSAHNKKLANVSQKKVHALCPNKHSSYSEYQCFLIFECHGFTCFVRNGENLLFWNESHHEIGVCGLRKFLNRYPKNALHFMIIMMMTYYE